ncbi:MAG: hypothetical protein B6D55_06145 [Candidatus Omnitrophica bacterium 4484_70.2]|nr:MAG: hypothetical protein B6D55_06145 [Candidatus Omnitrophica bacterium 4484_70.2]
MSEGIKRKVLSLGFFNLIENVFLRSVNIGSWIFIIRLLHREDVGIIGLSFGYLSFLNFINVAPETMLYRDFPAIKKSKKINDFISSFLLFSFYKFSVVLVVSFFISFFLYLSYHSLKISLFFVGISFILTISFFKSPVKELLKVDFKQKISTLIEITLSGISFIFLISGLYRHPTLSTYIIVYGLMSILGIIIWFSILKRIYNFKFKSEKAFPLLNYSLNSFSIWNHLNGSITYFIYNIDPAILSICGISLVTIGNYTTALKISNFFFFIPMIFQNTLGIAFSNLNHKKSIFLLKKIFLFNLIFGILQLLLFLYTGRWIIENFFTHKFVSEIFKYSLIIIIGITILNITRPLISWLTIKGNIKKVFFFTYLPTGIAAFPVYLSLTKRYGPTGTAFGNIILYSFFSFLLIFWMLWSYFKNEERDSK